MTVKSGGSARPKILVSGKNGQVGWELQRALMPVGDVIALDQQQMNLSSTEEVRDVIRAMNPDVIINAAAYTAVDKAEDEAQRVMQINATAPAIMAEEANRSGALLVHYSTDYVFNGSKQAAWSESDQPDPLGLYGASKYAAETALLDSDADCLVFRTSWVYAARGQNFLLTMLRLLHERDTLQVVDDQIGTPTWARLVATVTAISIREALQQRAVGSFRSELLHLTSTGETSWFGFAAAIRQFELSRGVQDGSLATLQAIASDAYPTRAERPKNSTLDCSLLEQRFGLQLPHWETAMQLCLEDYYDQTSRSVI